MKKEDLKFFKNLLDDRLQELLSHLEHRVRLVRAFDSEHGERLRDDVARQAEVVGDSECGHMSRS